MEEQAQEQGLMAHLGARLTHIGPGRVHRPVANGQQTLIRGARPAR